MATTVCWGNVPWLPAGYILAEPPGNDLAPPPAGERFTTLSIGYGHSCGLRFDGTAVCWSQQDYGQANPPGE